ncbi:MAG: SDR family oxidoreductase [Myxococcales bacterium]|nr:SDR family oxidoreductase [Myxococcales bacterium]
MKYQSIFRPDLFGGQSVIVTGGGSGIGRCIAHEFAALGATVILASRDPLKLTSVQNEITEDGGRAYSVVCNIRDESDVQRLFEETLRLTQRIDHVVNNAGGQFMSRPESISLKGWDAVLETNLTGTFLMCRAAYKNWMKDHGGTIVNIVADFWNGMPLMAHTGAARAGVVNLTQSLALAWVEQGVRVNSVAPGIIRSSGLTKYPPMVQQALKEMVKELPTKRLGTESEVSAAVVFLSSPAASYITGETMRVDGASSFYRQMMPIGDHKNFPRFEGFHRQANVPEDL